MPEFTTLEHLPGGVIYMASPYTSWLMDGMADEAHSAALDWQARLMGQGVDTYSPVAEGHLLSARWPFSEWDHERWLWWCFKRLQMYPAIVIPPIKGRSRSLGIKREKEFALSRNMPVVTLG